MIGQTISHYRILGQIGEGGMGVVYVAEDVRLGRRVAIKFPLAGSDEKNYRARFLREARAVSSISHKNIAAVYDYGETEEGQPYIVMELVTGQTLGEILSGPGVSVTRAVEIVADVAEALAAAHRRGVVHRDIKPSNVIVNERGEVKVLDFGLAKQFGDANGNGNGADPLSQIKTRSDVIIGTPLYLSPEQARGGKIDGRSDLFALGALLYECVAGKPAFSGTSVIEIGGQVLHVDPPPPSKFNPRVPAELDGVVLKALAKRPEERYQKAEEMVAALDRVLARLPAADTHRTRRIATPTQAMRASALMTISDGLRRPRLSPLAFVLALLALPLAFFAYKFITRPRAHVPTVEVLELYRKGDEAMRAGAYHRASKALEQAVEKDPQYVLAQARLAEAWIELDFFHRSREALLAVSQLDRAPLDEVDALYLKAVTATARREFLEATRAYDEIARREPKKPETHFDAGRAHERNGDTEKAAAAYLKATEVDPQYAPAFLRLGMIYVRQNNNRGALAFETAERIFREKIDAEGRAEVYYQRGYFYYTRGRIPEARVELEQALALVPPDGNQAQRIRLLLQLSAVAFAENEPDKAGRLARAALEAAQAHGMETLTARALVELGNVYLVTNKYEEAQRYYNQGLDYAVRFKARRAEAQAHGMLAGLYNQLGRPDDAIAHITPAIAFYHEAGFRKEESQAQLILGRAKRNKGDFEGALGAFNQQLRLALDIGDQLQEAQAREGVGSVYVLQEKYPDALEQFRQKYVIDKSLGRAAGLPYSLVELGRIFAQLGRYEEAHGQFEQAAELLSKPNAPKELAVHLGVLRAEMALSRQNYAEAVAHAEGAVALAGTQFAESVVDAKRVQGLARVLAGERREGLRLCAEAAEKADALGNEQLAARATLTLARAKLESGDARGALPLALRAQEVYTRHSQWASAWWSWAAAARAAEASADAAKAREYAAGASSALARLREQWGEEACKIFLDRPDVRYYYDRLGAK